MRHQPSDEKLQRASARVGCSSCLLKMMPVLCLGPKASRLTDLTALPDREAGTRKYVLARVFHKLDHKRRAFALKTVPCAVIRICVWLLVPGVLVLGARLINLPAVCAQANSKQREVVVGTPPQESLGQSRGAYYALVIGVANYQHLPTLTTPVNDAKEIERILRDSYGFKTQLLPEATRDQILDALDRDRRSLGVDDSLLIYYAGHGFYDPSEDQAYWAPIDAGQDTYSHWIIATEITSRAKAIPARHVLVVSDSCYSGKLARALDRNDRAVEIRDPFIERMLSGKSRGLMSSGGNEPVSDSDAPEYGKHSVFANALIRGLEEMTFAKFSASELFDQYVRVQVPGRSKQMPEYTAIRDSGHEGGDFVFFRKGKGIIQAASRDTIPSPTNPEKDAVRVALDRYQAAYASMDTDQLKQVWPSLSRDQLRELKSGFERAKAVIVELRSSEIALGGDAATVTADQWMKWTRAGHQQPPQVNPVEVQLKKAQDGTWLIDGVRGR
jgi:hypothetical protein